MDINELDKLLRELDDEEKILKKLSEGKDDKLIENEVKQVYSVHKDEGEWTINSEKLMEKNESLAIHKHKRFVAFKEHKHDYMELMYVFSGEVKQYIKGKEVIIKEGEMCIFDLNVSHSIEPSSENDIAVNILMKEEFFDSIFMSFLSDNDIMSHFIINALYHKKEYREYLVFHCENHTFIQTIMKRLLCEYFDKRIGADTAIHAHILLLFTELLRSYKENMGQNLVKDMSITIITEVKKYLCKNYKDIDLKTTAEHFHFNSDYLSKIIKNATGESFTGLLQEIRLKEACVLLENTNTSIEEIVVGVGYINVSYFYKLFKRKYKVTPIEYRNKKV